MKTKGVFSVLLFLLLSKITFSQTINLVQNLNPGTGDGLDEWNNLAITYNNTLIFPATDGSLGLELYSIKNGALSLIKDINTGSASAHPANFVLYDGKVFFTALDVNNGYEIWSTDGTESGTQLAIEISVGDQPSTDPGKLIVAPNGKLYFSSGGKVYVSEGSTATTTQIPNVSNVDFNEDFSIVSPNVAVYGQGIAFYSKLGTNVVMYSHDGNQLTNLKSFTVDNWTDVYGLVEVSNGLLYSISDVFNDNYNGIFCIDKTTGVTTEILNSANTHYLINRVIAFNGKKALFKDLNGGIFSTDGTKSGTAKITNASYTLYQGEKIAHAIFGDKIIFYGDEDFIYPRMYISDGTVSGTKLAATATAAYLSNMIQSGNMAYWMSGVNNGFNTEIWATNVTNNTSSKIYTFTETSATDESFLLGVSDSKLYLGTPLKGVGREVYSLAVTAPLSIDPASSNTVKLCNYGQDNFLISTENNVKIKVEMIDVNGQVISTIDTTTNTMFTINSNQSLYILKVSNQEGVVSFKVIN
jgi:ELWxxDGT repeat protein